MHNEISIYTKSGILDMSLTPALVFQRACKFFHKSVRCVPEETFLLGANDKSAPNKGGGGARTYISFEEIPRCGGDFRLICDIADICQNFLV